ncbi:MAG: excinuclease ABC subunit B [Erythrobacter sp.]|nr:excinuclease ABC subunit B [Erythrobacter sp.]NCQ64348.1 excinuclease ABC subunit B [Alphaproteobacteria bacterium]
MSKSIDDLQREMEAAARSLDFEEARRLRDRINLLRGGANAEEAAQADTTGLVRQQPGAMGLGTSRQRPIKPPDWKPPPKPDLKTSGRRSRQHTSDRDSGSP